jgi:hypothetical protein
VSSIRPSKPIGGVSSIPMLSGLESGLITGLGSISSGLLQCYQTVSSHVVLPRLLGHEPVCSRPKRIEVLQRAYGHIGVCRTFTRGIASISRGPRWLSKMVACLLKLPSTRILGASVTWAVKVSVKSQKCLIKRPYFIVSVRQPLPAYHLESTS